MQAHSTISWDSDLIALRDEIYAEQRAIRGDFTLQDAAKCAIAQLADLERYAAQWDQAADAELLARYWPHCETGEEVTPEPEPTPPTPTDAQYRKAAFYALQGVTPMRHGAGWLVASGSRASVVHFVGDDGRCSCEAGQASRPCWHLALTLQQPTRKAA